ncbi:uncharacterized protein [Dysidea avara]|uniref:uncharacterized protein isoform X2 n=1 Tax=Dysidea avara TaxID=196820 RepID=UPI003323AFD1
MTDLTATVTVGGDEEALKKRLPTKVEKVMLMNAIIDGDIGAVEKISNDGVDMDSIIDEEYQQRLLHVASYSGQNKIVKMLLSLNVNIDSMDYRLATPLHHAADDGFSDVVMSLLEAKATVNCQDQDNNTPLYLSCQSARMTIVEMLLVYGANIECRTKNGWTPLHISCHKGHTMIVKMLLQNNAKTDFRTNDYYTPLYLATAKGYNEVVKILLQSNADVNCVCKKNYTPLYIAAQRGHNEVAKTLLQANADVNCMCRNQATPIYAAIVQGHLDVVKTLLDYNVNLDNVNLYNETPLKLAVEIERSDIVKCLVEDGNIDITRLDQYFQERVTNLLQLEAVLEKSKTEVHKTLLRIQSEPATHSPVTIPKSVLCRSISSYTSNMTLKEVNEGYIDGSLPIVDPRAVLLGCEGSGKTSLIDTFVGNSFQNTPATEGADQMEISVTTMANWELMNEKQKLQDLKKQALLEAEFFLSIRKCCQSLDMPQSILSSSTLTTSAQPSLHSTTAATSTLSASTASATISSSSADKEAVAGIPKSSPQARFSHCNAPNHFKGNFVYITKEEFQELKTMTEKYDPKKKYIHLWDFAGQQIFQHLHGLFVSEEVVCLIVFNAGKSLYEVPGRRYPNDITPAKSAIKVICYWMELVSSRISRRSTDGDDLSELLPTFILVGTHIDELDADIEKAEKLAFEYIVPALIKELATKPFARHIAGSKNNTLFAKGSSSIFFLSNKDEMRNQVVINRLKRTVMKAASITRKVRPIRYVKMERKLMLLAYQENVYVIDKFMAREVAESCGITCTDKQLVGMLHHFHQKGALLHFHKVPSLSDIIILSPQWLAKLLTYVLTTLKCQPVGPPLAGFVEKLEKTGLLEQELLEWSLQQFSKDEESRGHNMLDIPGMSIAELLINFKLMVNISNTSLVGRKPRGAGKQLFLVPHLLPAERLVHSNVFGYYFYYYFPAKFIPEHLVDQLIVKCAEWNGSKQYDLLKLTYQWVCLELGKHQIYELEPYFDHHIICLKIIPEPNLPLEAKEKAFSDSNELVRSVHKFIDDLMLQHMTATFAKAPVICYIPCSQCMKMHLKVDKATENNTMYCPVKRVHADITDYHQILTGQNKLLNSNSSATAVEINDDYDLPTIMEQAPTMKCLHQLVIHKVAAEWKTIADFLDFESSTINIIQDQCRENPTKCCTELFREWLHTDLGLKPKTWSTLFDALKNVKQLTTVAEEIGQKLKNNQPADTAPTPDSKDSDILSHAPKMKYLNKFVIDRVAPDWKKVADSLEFDIQTIRLIEKKCANNPLDCCDELFRDWLSSDHGLKPKNWETLITALKDIQKLQATTADIEKDIKNIPV